MQRRLHHHLNELGLIGNVFHTKDIEAAIKKSHLMTIFDKFNSYTQKSVGQDCPGNSEDADDHEECTTTFAGKSDNVKDTTCS
jgi:hypothetical protein